MEKSIAETLAVTLAARTWKSRVSAISPNSRSSLRAHGLPKFITMPKASAALPAPKSDVYELATAFGGTGG